MFVMFQVEIRNIMHKVVLLFLHIINYPLNWTVACCRVVVILPRTQTRTRRRREKQ